jgi:uncharacterized metal-binding protein
MSNEYFSIEVEDTKASCPAGEKVGQQSITEGKIPVLSCEGACIRGEIARVAAHLVAKEEGFGRGCHGELFSVPQSAISRWIRDADKVVLIDGCFLGCHKRMMHGIIEEDRLIHFDALSHYKNYTEFFNIDDVPEDERNRVAREVADWVLENLGGKM